MGYRIILTKEDGSREVFLCWLGSDSPIFVLESSNYIRGYIFPKKAKAETEAANVRECWTKSKITVEATPSHDAERAVTDE